MNHVRYNYKVVGKDLAGHKHILHRCNSQTECERVKRTEEAKGEYVYVYWTWNRNK